MPKPTTKWKLFWNLPGLIKRSLALFKSPLIPYGRKIAVVLISLSYLLWPMDLIPDLPLIGQIDDLFIIFFLLKWFVSKGEKDISSKMEQDVIETDYYISDNDENKE